MTAQDNYATIKGIFNGFPEYLTNDMYIMGESYAGVFVPTLALLIHETQLAGLDTDAPVLNLVGIAVGNGCTGSEVGACSPAGLGTRIKFLFSKGLFPTTTMEKLEAYCGDYTNLTKPCQEALAEGMRVC